MTIEENLPAEKKEMNIQTETQPNENEQIEIITSIRQITDLQSIELYMDKYIQDIREKN